MRTHVRRALVAATVTAALALPSGASAACMPVCLADVYAALATVECPSICPEELERMMDKALAEHEGDESGTLCAYVKLTPGPPPDWRGGSGPPYIWVETEEWGTRNEDHYDHKRCVYACDAAIPELPAAPDPGGPSLTAVRQAVETAEQVAACAEPLLP